MQKRKRDDSNFEIDIDWYDEIGKSCWLLELSMGFPITKLSKLGKT